MTYRVELSGRALKQMQGLPDRAFDSLIEAIGDFAFLQVTGEVDVDAAPMLREQVRKLATKGAVHLIADLGQMDFLDSTGLGALVGGLKRLRETDGSLPLVAGPIKTAACIRRILAVNVERRWLRSLVTCTGRGFADRGDVTTANRSTPGDKRGPVPSPHRR